MPPLHGRGARDNPANRFEPPHYAPDPGAASDDRPAPATQLFRDRPRTLITTNDSPGVGFDASINPYRGWELGCIYCSPVPERIPTSSPPKTQVKSTFSLALPSRPGPS